MLQKKRTEGSRRAEDVAGERHGSGELFGVAMMDRCNERLPIIVADQDRDHRLGHGFLRTRYGHGDISLFGLPLVRRRPTSLPFSLHFYWPSFDIHTYTHMEYLDVNMLAYLFFGWSPKRQL